MESLLVHHFMACEVRIILFMNKEIANNIFSKNELPDVHSIRKLEVGFTNEVYEINDRYILKVCGKKGGEENFNREATLYEYFSGNLPVPELINFDDSKKLHHKSFMICYKITGENLYNVWHTYTNTQRRDVVKQLCGLLKIINETSLAELPAGNGLGKVESWKYEIVSLTDKHLKTLAKMKALNTQEVSLIESFVQKNSYCLEEQKLALVYWDAHFDNILVADGQIVGLLDLEATEIASIDHALDVVKRMVEHPKKYMSEYAKQFARDEDYGHLLVWYEEFYPELFQFKNLDLRLDFYTIEHDLWTLTGWSEVKSLKDIVLDIVNKK